MMKDVFIIGSKGIPARYGGFETFVEKLTKNKRSNNINYHIACLGNTNKEFTYNNSRCFNIKVPNIGSAKAVCYDILALNRSINYIEKNNIKNALIYILACRIGPFLGCYKKKINKLGIKIYINPDGHEWKRGKWNYFIKKYWKFSEDLMVKYSDEIICDSINIEKYINTEYYKYSPNTRFIAYGAELGKSKMRECDKKLIDWYKKYNVQPQKYYLVVGRFVKENNYELMIKEFMKSKSNKDFVIITNIEKNKFYDELNKRTLYKNDKRIKFVGTVYEEEMLKKIRENAYGYFHGHEVGGTNPSLLEALSFTKINILLDVGFNREVAEESAIYFTKEENSLAEIINQVDKFHKDYIDEMGEKAKKRIKDNYSWEEVVKKYEKLFLI